jgi:predicted metal-dependent enzyme (double-stranded beta helix superfamily)
MELFEESLGLVDHLHRLRNAFRPEDDEASITDHSPVEKAVVGLVNDKQVAVRVMERLAHDMHFLHEQAANLFNNEVVIWREPDNSFSIRLFIWTNDCDNFVHDHNAWGMIAGWWGDVSVENYNRVDTDGGEETAKLQLRDKLILKPGQTTMVRPFAEGIHRVTCAKNCDMALSLSVYAKKIGERGYLLKYDLETKKVYRVYHRSRRRKEWAKEMLSKMTS